MLHGQVICYILAMPSAKTEILKPSLFEGYDPANFYDEMFEHPGLAAGGPRTGGSLTMR